MNVISFSFIFFIRDTQKFRVVSLFHLSLIVRSNCREHIWLVLLIFSNTTILQRLCNRAYKFFLCTNRYSQTNNQASPLNYTKTKIYENILMSIIAVLLISSKKKTSLSLPKFRNVRSVIRISCNLPFKKK